MAIGRFDDVLQMITDEQERQAILKSIEKNPEAKKALTQLDGLVKDGVSYNDWYLKEYPDLKKKAAAHDSIKAELDAANKTIDGLKAGNTTAGKGEHVDLGDMTVEQIEERMLARMKKDGFVTRAEAESLADQKAREAAAAVQGRVYTQGLPMVERMMKVQDKFRVDFGKDMDRAAFGKFIADNQFTDIDKAYEAFTRDNYVEKVKVDSFEQGKLAGAKETAERLGKENAENALRGLPSDMNGTNGFQSRPGAPPEPVALKDIPEDYQLGRKGGFKLANAIAAQIERDRAEGKLMQ